MDNDTKTLLETHEIILRALYKRLEELERLVGSGIVTEKRAVPAIGEISRNDKPQNSSFMECPICNDYKRGVLAGLKEALDNWESTNPLRSPQGIWLKQRIAELEARA